MSRLSAPANHKVAWAIAACALLFGAPYAHAEKPIRFRHVIKTEAGALPIDMELYLTAVNDDVIAVKVAGNLGALQSAMPRMLSQVVEDTCARRIGVEVQDVRAEVDTLRLTGRIQILTYLCPDAENFDRRLRILSNITEFDALVGARIEDSCLKARLLDLTIDPSGLAGGILNVTGLSDRIAEKARAAINDAVEQKLKCLDLPHKLQIVGTHVESGGFRDFGEGQMGFVVQGSINVDARHVVTLVNTLAEEGGLRD